MSFGGFDESNRACGRGRVTAQAAAEATMPIATGVVSQTPFHTTHPLLSSTGLSLGLKTNVDGAYGSEMMAARIGPREFRAGGREGGENESRSDSDNYLEGVSGEDFDPENPNARKKRKRYHRHTPQQIQELENVFKECPHPDDKQRMELSKRLCLENRQVKFWFQNRRTQMKTQLERHENSLLRLENDKLRSENMAVNDAIRNPICTNCGGPAMLAELSLEEHHLRMENARLRDELERVCSLTGRFLARPLFPSIPPNVPNSSLELAVGVGNALSGFGSLPPLTNTTSTRVSVYLDLALSAMNELEKLVHMKAPIWIPHSESGMETINHEEYHRVFPRVIGEKPIGFVSEATRETGNVIINSSALVDTLMDADRWCDMFSCMIARASTTDVISNGMAGTRNGALQLMHAEFQVLSPLVPIREANFLRFCKQHADGLWVVVDVSVDAIINSNNTFMSCRRLPSGCVVQDLCNGYSKVTWVEHVEYDESAVHQLYRPLLRSGMGLGAQRWLSTLRRQCECLGILMSPTAPSRYLTAITAIGRRSMLKLAQRMTDNFCAGVCPSTVHQWNILRVGTVDEDVRVMTRKSVDDPGEPPGVVLSAATSVWLPVSSQRLFDFLRDERLRSEWDILSNGGPMQEMAHITKGQDVGNCVSLLRSSAMSGNQSSMLILQETCTDPSASLVVYAPVDIPAMQVVMNGGDSAYVALLPSGFAIVPVSQKNTNAVEKSGVSDAADDEMHSKQHGGGSLLTVAFQILVNSLPTAKLTVESVETVNNLISCTVQKIKASLQCENIPPAP